VSYISILRKFLLIFCDIAYFKYFIVELPEQSVLEAFAEKYFQPMHFLVKKLLFCIFVSPYE